MKSLQRSCSHILSGAAALVLAGCSGPSVRLLDRPVAPNQLERILGDSTSVSAAAEATLQAEGLGGVYRKRPEEAMAVLAGRYRSEPNGARGLALAELCADQGDRLVGDQPQDALGRYLDAMSLTERSAREAAERGELGTGRILYNKCAVQVARVMHARAEGTTTAPGVLRTYQLDSATGAEFVDPRDFKLIVPTAWVQFEGVDLAPIRVEGFGAPMIGHRPRTAERVKTEPHMPGSGHSLALNASVRFSGSRATLGLQDLMMKGRTVIDGREVTLAGDFTAALAFYYYDRKKEGQKILATLRPEKFRDRTGLFTIEPFRENKIPLVIVHGLLSTAEDWMPFVNILRADPVVRERYQMVFFNYPSGTPIENSSGELRQALVKYRDTYDPKRNHAKMRDMVILGHSMGGILSDLQIRDSGDQLEQLFLKRPLGELELSAAESAQLRQRLHFEANPDITRAIFMAAPHRGSDIAANPIGQIGAWLIRFPFDLMDSVLGELVVVDALTDVAQNMVKRPPNSVNSLRPDNPLLPATLALPVRQGVQVHSIIARKKVADPLLESSDGIVPYTSAHLEGVRSEVIIEGATHTSMVTRGETVQEVWRLLRRHAGMGGR